MDDSPAISLAMLVIAARHIPSATGRSSQGARVETDITTQPRTALWKDGRLALIAVVVLAMTLAEGTAGDCLPLVMVDGHGLNAALGSAVYAGFATAMTVGRFVIRFGRARVLRVSITLGAVGMLLVSLVNHPVVTVLAVVLWGLGASLGFPLALSAAGESGPDPARRVSFAATIGYVAFLVGPPVIGFVGEHSLSSLHS